MKLTKDIFQGLIVLLLLSIFFIIFSYVENNYTRIGYVTKVNEEEMIITDLGKHKWIVTYNSNFNENDKVKLFMNTNNTEDNTKDDIIINIKKIK